MPRSRRLITAIVGPALLAGATVGVGTAMAATPGVITEYPSGTGVIGAAGIGVAPNGTAYGVFNNLNLVVPFTTAGRGTQIPVGAAGGLVSSIAPGPDGNMWMTYNFTATMGRLNTATGVTTQYGGLDTPGWASAAGPDGRQWVTLTGGQIAAVPMSGSTTNYAIPTPGAVPIGIAQGPDGRMWFSEGTGNKIGAITTSGQMTEYTLPTPDSDPQYIAAGPDGNMWFTQADANKIGRITMSGVVTEYPVPTPNANPRGIAAGADGNMWFTEPMAGKVASITMAGAITEYSAGLSPNSYPAIIAAGQNGLMWFSNENAASVGSITTGNTAPAPPPPPVPTPSVKPSGPTDVVTPVTSRVRTATSGGRTTITFRLRYAASGNYAFRLETRAGKVLPMLAGTRIAGTRVKAGSAKVLNVRGARKGRTVAVTVVMKGKPAKGTALRAIVAGPKGSRTTETIPV